jgi:alkylation response protein AidB-like acyl-CoA dehydrogenase
MIDMKYENLRQDFAQFGSSELACPDIAQRARDGQFDSDLWRRCGERRIPGLAVPVEYGGAGLSAPEMVAALEGVGYGCEDSGLLFAAAAQLLACAIPLWKHGTDAQRERYLADMCSGELIATNAMTEEQGGSDAFYMLSSAMLVKGEYQMSGLKSYCANAPLAQLCLTYVSTDPNKEFMGGISGFLLDSETHGFTVSAEVEKFGLRTCRTGRISLEGVRALPSDLLGKQGAGGMIFNQSMDWERTGMAALQIGTMTRLLERAINFSQQRKSGGKAISRYQAVSHRLVDLQTELSAGRLLVYQAAHALERGGRSAAQDACMAKLFVSERFKAMTGQLMQIYASTGYEADSEIARSVQDAMAATLYSGTSEVQRNIIAGWMGC